MENTKNLLLPEIATIKKIIKETPNIISLQLVLDDKDLMRDFSFEPGQVGQISVFGFGESTFVINSPPSNKDYLQFSIMKTGFNTTAIHNLSEGEKVVIPQTTTTTTTSQQGGQGGIRIPGIGGFGR